MKKLIYIIILNLLGIALFFSWYNAAPDSFWPVIDKKIFFTFNEMLVTSETFKYVVAFTNLRFFDVFGFLAMFLLFLCYFIKMDKEHRRWMLCMGVTMLITAVLVKQFSNCFNIERPSATLYFTSLGEQVNYVSQMTGWPAKDASKSSFPGDHGMCLIIFCVYMLRYFGLKPFLVGIVITAVFSLPRMMSGAHWFSDVAVGSVAGNLVALSWLLLTPASDFIIRGLMKLVHWKIPDDKA